METDNLNFTRKFLQTILYIFIFLTVSSVFGCRKFLEVDTPSTSTNAENVYLNDNTAAAVLTGLYSRMAGDFFSDGFLSLSLYPEMSGDNLVPFYPDNRNYLNYYRNTLTSSGNENTHLWIKFYTYIYSTNAAIEGLYSSKSLTSSVRDQLIGEALFIRAVLYFYLVNLYGPVPLVTSTDYKINSALERSPIEMAYKLMILDLQKSTYLLSSNYLKSDAHSPYELGNEERVRPTKWAALAMLARIHLYRGQWAEAEQEATEIINNQSLFDMVAIDEIFLKNSKEALLQFQPVNVGENTKEGRFFTLPNLGPNLNNPVFLSADLVNSFERGDLRLKNWIDSVSNGSGKYYFATKYKIATLDQPVYEYSMVLRLTELYLIRSEAKLQLGDDIGALNDLNVLRERASLLPLSLTSKVEMHNAILEERRHEFFLELGQRWFDLKRLNRLDIVMTSLNDVKKRVWKSSMSLYPIPQSEIQANSNLKQNEGY